MKIAVYSIAKNEEQFVERWVESCKDADYRFILDTGSEDGTQSRVRACSVDLFERVFTPWRFDAARNLSLALLPSDIDWCIALDLDEQLRPDWREIIEKTLEGRRENRFRYEYIWSWKAEGVPDLIYYGDKIHRRHTHFWKHPVHEVLTAKGSEEQIFCESGPLIEHHPDSSKSRSNYLPLLKIAVEEDPWDDRNAHYYGRELYYRRQYHEAIEELQRHLSLPKAVWKAERAWSMRFISECHWGLGQTIAARDWMLHATEEEPGTRDLWCCLAQLFFDLKEWGNCADAAAKALTITERGKIYMSEARAWGSWPYHLLSVTQWHLGLKENAIKNGSIALQLDPENNILKGNLNLYMEGVEYGKRKENQGTWSTSADLRAVPGTTIGTSTARTAGTAIEQECDAASVGACATENGSRAEGRAGAGAKRSRIEAVKPNGKGSSTGREKTTVRTRSNGGGNNGVAGEARVGT
jgi:tetratricopeptide (TPR) repeat protein